MRCSTAQAALLVHLWPAPPPALPLSASVVAHLAGCPNCRKELATLTETFTGHASMLSMDAASLTCAECLEHLPAFVEDEASGVDVSLLHPAVSWHIAGCSECRAVRVQLQELLRAESLGGLNPAPDFASFGARYRRQHPESNLWLPRAEHFYHLAIELVLRVTDATVAFWHPPAQLAIQLVPVRDDLAPDVAAEPPFAVLELPHPETNTVLRVSTGPVREGLTTLVLTLAELIPPRPVAHARVTLYDESGALLEAAATDDDGLVLFRDLDRGRYAFRAEYADTAWQIVLSLG